MTRLRVEPGGISALGERLADLSSMLSGVRDCHDLRWAFAPGACADALDDVMGNWSRQRLVTARLLAELAEAAQDAGGCYLRLEDDVSRSLVGGPTR